MQTHSYERLSAQDHSFLLMEDPNIHMHVGGVQVFEAGPLKTPDGGINAGLYKRAIASVLYLVPRYRQRLMWTPIENRPIWVDDAAFNLDYHIRHTALPHPGDEEELKRLTARIMAQQLDRARPLWEMWVVEGLQADRFAVLSKLHHCMVDGISGVDLAHRTLSPTPDYEIHEPPPFVAHTAPSSGELLQDAVVRHLSLPFQVAGGWSNFRRETKHLGRELRLRAQAIADLIEYSAQPAPETPLNGALGPHRRVDWLSMPLGPFKAIGKACDCTVNDVALATVAGAVREFLISRRVHPGEIGFRLAVPVSVRRKEEHEQLGNRGSSWLVELPVGEADPRKRLAVVKTTTHDLKVSQQALGVEMMMAVAEWTPTVLLSLGMRATSGAANMVVTNVPGPRMPLYFLGTKVLAFYPVVPLIEHTGLAVGLISYADRMCWGFNADYDLVPDLGSFVEMINASFNELSRVAGVGIAAAPPEITQREVAGRRSAKSSPRGKRKHRRATSAKRRPGPQHHATVSSGVAGTKAGRRPVAPA